MGPLPRYRGLRERTNQGTDTPRQVAASLSQGGRRRAPTDGRVVGPVIRRRRYQHQTRL